MKATLLSLAFALAVASTALAQRLTVDPVVGFGASHVLAPESSIRGAAFDAGDIGYAYRAGAAASYRLNDRTFLSAGLRYAALSSRRAQTTDDLRWGSQWNGTTFDPRLPSGELIRPTGATLTERVSLLELPIEVRRVLNDGRGRFYVQGGVVPSVVLGATLRTQVNDVRPTSTETDRFSRVWLAATAGVGYEWQCCDALALYAQLGGNVQLFEEFADSRSRRWDAGLVTGVRVSL